MPRWRLSLKGRVEVCRVHLPLDPLLIVCTLLPNYSSPNYRGEAEGRWSVNRSVVIVRGMVVKVCLIWRITGSRKNWLTLVKPCQWMWRGGERREIPFLDLSDPKAVGRPLFFTNEGNLTRKEEDFTTFAPVVNKRCDDFRLAELSADNFKCLVFVQGLISTKDSQIRHRILNKLEDEPNITLQQITEDCPKYVSVKQDSKTIEESGIAHIRKIRCNKKPNHVSH